MPKQKPITRTFGLELAHRCPQCDKLAQKVRKATGSIRKRQEVCPACQTDLEKGLAINPMPEVFNQFARAVNILIKQGIHTPNHLFTLDSLKAAKYFYNSLSKDNKVKQVFNQLDLHNRVRRCAAQYAYFAIWEYKRRVKDIQLLCPIIAKEIRHKGLTSLQGEEYPTRALVKACWIQLRQEYGYKDQMSRYELTNRLRHIRNLLANVLKEQLKAEEGEVVRALTVPEGHINAHLNKLDRTSQEQPTEWARNFVKQLSRLLTQRINRNKKNTRPIWGKGFFDDLIEEIIGQKAPLDDQGRITLTDAAWQAVRRTWRNELLGQLQKKGLRQSLEEPVLVKVKDHLTPSYVLKQVFKPRPARFRYTKEPQKDFRRYQVHQLIEELKDTFITQNKPLFTKLVLQACKKVSQDPPHWLKIPHYEAQAIPLGIDDNCAYKLGFERDPAIDPKKENQDERPEEIFVRLTLRPCQPVDYRINDPKRWVELVAQGYTPQKPVLHKKPGGGALVLAVPFTCPPRPSKPKDNTIPPDARMSTAVDLGLKVLAALSITQGVQPLTWAKGTTFKDLKAQFSDKRVEAHELARYFLDQEHLSRPAKDWFNRPPPGTTHPAPNIKRHLFNLREEAKRLQSQKDTYRSKHQKTYRTKVKYKRLKREWQRIWNHISGIHEDMAKQLATRIVRVSQAYNSQVIRFEDLKWSQTTKKEDAGYWLATWQVHWFHSEIIRHTKMLATRQGIKVELVVAKGTSYRCSSCGQVGERIGKMFYCPHCQRHLDSDLNAARNIAVAPISPDATRVRGELPYPGGNAGEPSGSKQLIRDPIIGTSSDVQI
ncbi:MAG: zinc ribbon domain-containing protein [Candidatus Hermodarchaeota archaeon]